MPPPLVLLLRRPDLAPVWWREPVQFVVVGIGKTFNQRVGVRMISGTARGGFEGTGLSSETTFF